MARPTTRQAIVDQVRQALIESIDPKTLARSDYFFKQGETAKVHGVRMGEVGKIAKLGVKQIKGLPK
jgi:hypothetical protein